MPRMRPTWILGVAIGAWCTAFGDLVFLNNGGQLEGQVREVGDKIELTTASGATLSIQRSQVKRIIKKKLPADELRERKAKLDATNSDAVFKMALWCQANGFKADYESYLKRTISLEPDHPQAKKILYKYRKTYRSIPTNKVASAKLEREFGPNFKTTRTKHFRICYNTETAFADHRADLFERVYRSFYGFFEEREFPTTTMKDRMEVVLFDTREEFQRYAATRNPTLENAAGFFAPTENRVTFYNSLNDANYRRQKQQILSAEKWISNLRKQLSQARASRFIITGSDGSKRTLSKQGAMSFLSREEAKIRTKRRGLANYYKKENVTTTVHECLHQLAFNLGVQKITGDNPKWLGEGLATFFETASAGTLRQVGGVNQQRLEHYRQVKKAGGIIPLGVLVSQDEVYVVSANTAMAAYAQGWGLVHFLLKNREETFLKYLLMLRDKKITARVLPTTRLNEFKQHFGSNLPALEKQWQRYMDAL